MTRRASPRKRSEERPNYNDVENSQLYDDEELEDQEDSDMSQDEEFNDKLDQDRQSQAPEENEEAIGQEQEPEEVPVKRKRGRPPSKNKRLSSLPTLSQGDRNSTPPISDPNEEEIDHPHIFDPKGEEKITPDGFLLGGREYRFRTYVLPRHPTRLYCFSLEAAKILGYRDSYILYTRNPHIKRIIATDADRDYLTEIGEMPSMYKNRPLALCNPRILFKNFGHQVVVRGVPVRDDYQVGDRVESAFDFHEGRFDDEESEFGGEFARKLAGMEGGPFHYFGSTALRFGTKVNEEEFGSLKPAVVPMMLAQDNWMYKCALSAAEFNRRLNKLRPVSFLDLHTNLEQIPSSTQPSRIQVEMKSGSESLPGYVQSTFVTRRAGDMKESGWNVVVKTGDASKYPLAVMKGQYQSVAPLHQARFQDEESPFFVARSTDLIPPTDASVQSVADYSQSPWGDVIAFNAQSTSTPSEEIYTTDMDLSAKKRSRPKTSEHLPLCCHCNSLSAPSYAVTNPSIPSSLLLTCTKCATKHHPACLEFDDVVMLSKIQTYDWHCNSCKVCIECDNSDNDDRLLFCDMCDRGYHTFCLQPPLESLPEGSWLCPSCAICRSCNQIPSAASSDDDVWEHVVLAPKPEDAKQSVGTYFATYCRDCYGDFEMDRFCPFCLKTYKEDSDEIPMACCDSCERWIHVGCDPYLTQRAYEKLTQDSTTQYQCSFCNSTQRDAIFHKKKARKDGKHFKLVEYKDNWLFAPAFAP